MADPTADRGPAPETTPGRCPRHPAIYDDLCGPDYCRLEHARACEMWASTVDVRASDEAATFDATGLPLEDQ